MFHLKHKVTKSLLSQVTRGTLEKPRSMIVLLTFSARMQAAQRPSRRIRRTYIRVRSRRFSRVSLTLARAGPANSVSRRAKIRERMVPAQCAGVRQRTITFDADRRSSRLASRVAEWKRVFAGIGRDETALRHGLGGGCHRCRRMSCASLSGRYTIRIH